MTSYPTVTIQGLGAALGAALDADIPLLIVGSPGVGKSTIVEQVARARGLPCHVLLGSTVDPTDIGGLPVPREHGVERIPLGLIRECSTAPGLLFLDELSCAPPSVQAALLRLILDRSAGDTRLHPGSRVIAACNPPEQAPGGFELSAPLTGRLTILSLVPTLDEVRGFFRSVLPARADTSPALASLAADWAATTEVETGLIQLDPPPASVTGGAPWGAPRNWERGLRGFAAAEAAGGRREALRAAYYGMPGEVAHALLAGAVGEDQAIAYQAIRRLRAHLPSADVIARDPAGAPVPEERDRQIAALGLLAQVAARDTWAAWIYTARLDEEIACACARSLATVAPVGPAMHAADGKRARVKVLAVAGRALQGVSA